MTGKRLFDLSIAIIMFPFAAIIVLALMAVIAVDSPGNPLFIQRRVGRGQKLFNLVKLRTMYVGTAHVASHDAPAATITKMGRLLRKTKLDELPQIWNILVGDMSFVGPRPCLPSQKELIDERERRGVYEALPGITGPAQLAGIDMSTPGKLAIADASYLESRSWRGDMVLLLATAFGKGAGDAVMRKC